MNIGPDAARLLHAASGQRVPRPFHLRVVLPAVCRTDPTRWWVSWGTGWVLAAAGMFSWATTVVDWPAAALATALLLGLPGFLGPTVTIPVSVDIPANGLALCGVALAAHGQLVAGVAVIVVSAGIRETTPIWAALWLWSPWPLIGLAVPAVANWFRPTGPDPLGGNYQRIADQPIRTALEHHTGRWRDAWLLVAPWGVCLAGLVDPTPQVIVVLIVAHLQLLVATDTVRIVHHAAGPVLAIAAAQTIPTEWMLAAAVAHVMWWRPPERV